MDPDMLKAFLGSAVRHALVLLGGYFVKIGILPSDGANEFVGAGMIIAALGWSFWQKYGHSVVDEALKRVTGRGTTAGAVATAQAVEPGAATKMCLAFLAGLFVLSLLTASAYAQPAQQPPLAGLFTKLAADAQVALKDAQDHNDDIAANCWKAIAVVATAKAVESTPAIGVLIAFQKVRDITRLNSSPQGTALIMGCAPLVQDSKLNMLQFFTNIGGAVLIKGLLIP